MEKMDLSLQSVSGTALTSMMHSGDGITDPFSKPIFITKQIIVGTRFQGGADQLLDELEPGSRVSFLREPENEFDPKAVAAFDEKGRKLGFIPRNDNHFMSALMDAGKFFYGIVADDPVVHDKRGELSTSFVVDLYMNEFRMPGDPLEAPKQGADASYAVVDFVVSETSKQKRIAEIYAIRVINGEERGNFYRKIEKPVSKTALRKLYEAFRDYIGELPIVGFEIPLKIVTEQYGLLLGMAFSNRVIDTKEMVKSHDRKLKKCSLKQIAEYCEINTDMYPEEEQNVRIVWEMYRRMSRSHLDEPSSHGDPEWILDQYIDDVPLSRNLHFVLQKYRIATLRQVSRMSRLDLIDLYDLDDSLEKELTDVMKPLCPDFPISITDEDFLYGYPEEMRRIAEEKEGPWEYLLFFHAVITHYKWLEDARRERSHDWDPSMSGTLKGSVTNAYRGGEEIVRELEWNIDHIQELCNEDLPDALGEPEGEGDARRIIEVAEEIMSIYRNTILDLQNMDYFIIEDPEAEKVIMKVKNMLSGFCGDFDVFYRDIRKAVETIEMRQQSKEKHRKPLKLSITFCVSLGNQENEKRT